MPDRIVLDETPLSHLCQRTMARGVPAIRSWLRAHVEAGTEIVIPEIADYEVRRELIRAGKTASIARLDRLQSDLGYLPLTTAVMQRAAEMWAQARSQGRPTAAPEALDADVILAAQAESIGAIVATENVGHLGRFVVAKSWRDLPAPS